MGELAYKACGEVVCAIAGLSRQEVAWVLLKAKECHDNSTGTALSDAIDDEYVDLANAIRCSKLTKQQHLLIAAYHFEAFLGEKKWTTPDLVHLLGAIKVEIEPVGICMQYLVSKGLVRTVQKDSKRKVLRSLTRDRATQAKEIYEKGRKLAPGAPELAKQD